MRTLRLLLLIALIPLAPNLARHSAVAWSTIDGVWSEYRLATEDRAFREFTAAVETLHTPFGAPEPGDWRDTVIQPAQSFSQYALSEPVGPTSTRRTIYVQPLGSFTAAQRRIVTLCSEYLSLYFSSPVDVLPDLEDDLVSDKARRIHPWTGEEQFHSTWVRRELLQPRLPDDATALIALTATDLWPGGDTNFVFGQASLKERVGVWSMARFGDPEAGPWEFTECLRRTLGIAAHETGHMFSMKHCVFFECNMAGSGSLEEADKHPLYLCPECLAKLHWSTRPDESERMEALAQFCFRHGLNDAEEYYSTAARLLAR